jgi:hypothetical protein
VDIKIAGAYCLAQGGGRFRCLPQTGISQDRVKGRTAAPSVSAIHAWLQLPPASPRVASSASSMPVGEPQPMPGMSRYPKSCACYRGGALRRCGARHPGRPPARKPSRGLRPGARRHGTDPRAAPASAGAATRSDARLRPGPQRRAEPHRSHERPGEALRRPQPRPRRRARPAEPAAARWRGPRSERPTPTATAP